MSTRIVPLLQCIQPRILVFRGSRGGALLERIPGAREHHVLDCVVRRALSWISAHRLARHRARIVGADRRRSRGGVANCPPSALYRAHERARGHEGGRERKCRGTHPDARHPACRRGTEHAAEERDRAAQRHRDLGVLIRWTWRLFP